MPPRAGPMLMVVSFLVTAVSHGRAQCTITALPPLTQFVADQPAECEVGQDIEEGGACVVECIAGNSQGDGGYTYSCLVGGELTEPTPDCEPCPEGFYQSLPMPVAPSLCTECPADSTTELPGQTDPSSCLCSPGYSGDIVTGEELCEACPLGEYKPVAGPAACDLCPEQSSTENPASTAPTECLCNAGYSGEILTGEEQCEACAANTYKTDPGAAPCTVCPENSFTAEGEDGATEPAACVCDADNGWTGEIISPADLCRRETGLGPGLIVLMSVAVGLGAALGAAGFLYRLRVSPMVGGN